MRCTACDRENRDDAAFCAQCGTPLTPSCTSCGRELVPDSRFCDGCGAPVGAATPHDASRVDDGSAARKTVTAMFCDLVGSTSFGERVEAESARTAMAEYFELVRSVADDHRGTVAKFIGDGALVLFGVPQMAEDDAERAVGAALDLQRRFAPLGARIGQRHGSEIGLRVGINTGELVIAHGDDDLVGDTLNTAARLESACPAGGVMVGEPTWRLTRAAFDYRAHGVIEAKGKRHPVVGYEAVAPHMESEGRGTPFVGRASELDTLRATLDEAIAERTARMVTVIGEPGVGKTRLTTELGKPLGGRSFDLRCRRSGTATFAPIAALVRDVAGITEDDDAPARARRVRDAVDALEDAERVADLLVALLGDGPTRSTEELFLGLRRLVEALGADGPVVITVDDVQWAEPLLLDLLEHLSEWVRSVPLLIIGVARPELRDLRPSMTEVGRGIAAVVALEGLPEDATAELATRLVGADSLPAELLDRLPESTQGNPLFVRELMRMLVDDGVITEVSGTWELAIDLDALEVPPTVTSLLASRVDRLSPAERRALELAAVVGSEFPIGAVVATRDDADREVLTAAFERLRRKDLVEPTGSYWGNEPVYRFHHVLIRDAAYRRLLKRSRAEMHRRVGDWTVATAATLLGEHEVQIGNHFERAYRYRCELDLLDDETRQIGERAASQFLTAARRALDRDDLAAAGSLALRALDCIDDDHDDVADLLLIGCEATLGVGDVSAGVRLVERLGELAGALGDARVGAWTECYRAQVAVFTDPNGLEDAERRSAAAAGELERLGDPSGVAKARLQRAAALARLGRVEDCEHELDLGLTAGRAADDRRRIAAILGAVPPAALWGPSPVQRAGGRCLDVARLLRVTRGSPAVEATSIRCQAVLEAMRGRFDTARSMLDSARTTLRELGLRRDLMETELYAGVVELIAGDARAAEGPLRQAQEGLGRMGIGADAGQAAAHLARSLLRQGRLEEADQMATESAALAGQNPQTAIISRAVAAEVRSAQGSHADAAALADEAVSLAEGTDILVDHAFAVACRARVRAAAGDTAEANADRLLAHGLYERKGATALSEQVANAGGMVARDPLAQDAATDAGPDGYWNIAHHVAFSAARALTVPNRESWARFFADDVVIRDRRAAASAPAGVQDLPATMRRSHTGGGDARPPALEPVAARGDDLILFDVADVGLILARLGDEGVIDGWTVFGSDDLHVALDEIDEQFIAQLDPLPATHYRTFMFFRNEAANRDADAFASRFTSDAEVVDHRPWSWGSHGIGAVRERMSALFEVADSVIAVPTRILVRDASVTAFVNRYEVRNIDGSSVTHTHIAVTRIDPAGLVSRMDQFADDDEAAAVRTAHELLAAMDPIERTRPAQAGSYVNLSTRYGSSEALRLIVSPNAEFEDVDGNATPLTGLEAARAAGFGTTERHVLQVRGDRLALTELGDDPILAVEEYTEDGRLVRVSHLADNDHEAALARLDERWRALDRPDADDEWWNDAHRVAAQIASRTRSDSADRPAELVADDAMLEDRRATPVSVLRGRSHVVAAAPWSGARFDATAARGEDLVLLAEDGVGRVLVELDDDGRVQRWIIFAADELHPALDELARAYTSRLDPLWAAFHQPYAAFTREIARKDVDAYSSRCAPDLVSIDHRPIGWAPSDYQSLRERMEALFAVAESVTAVIERFLHLDLVVAAFVNRYLVHTTDGAELTDAHIVVVHVNTAGLVDVMDQFLEADGPDAMARVRALMEDLQPVERTRPVRSGALVNQLTRMGSGDGLALLVSIDAVVVDPDDNASPLAADPQALRAAGFGGTRRRVLDVRGDRLALTELGDHDDPVRLAVEEYADDGRLVSVHRFAAEDLAAASAHLDERWQELGHTPSPSSEREFLNEAHRLARRAFERLLTVDAASEWREVVAENIVIEDRRRGAGQVAVGLDAVVERWGDPRRRQERPVLESFEPVAVRGDDLILHRSVARFAGTTSTTREVLAVNRFSDDRLLTLGMLFDADQLDAAVTALDRLYVEQLAPLDAARHVMITGASAAAPRKDLGGMLSYFHPDFTIGDHRSIGWEAQDLDGFAQRMRSLFESVDSVVSFTERYLRIDETLGLVVHRFATRTTHGAEVMTGDLLLTRRDASGALVRMEQFAEDDADTALARFDELAASTDPLEVTRPGLSSAAINVLTRAGRFDLVEPLLAEGAMAEQVGGGSSPIAATPHALAAAGFGGTDRRVVAERASRAALFDIGQDDGTRVLAVEEYDEDARLLRTRLFPVDKIREAMLRLEEVSLRFAAVSDETRDLVLALLRSAYFDPEAMAALLHPDFELHDHRPIGAGSLDADGWLAMRSFQVENDAVAIHRQLHAVHDAGLVTSGSIWVDPSAHARLEMASFVMLNIFEGGLQRRLEFYAEDQIDDALGELEAAQQRA